MERTKFAFGTKEWAPYNFNFMNGCSNDCVYCYAKEMAIRFKRKTYDDWKNEEHVDLACRSYGKKNGPIMVPSSHDITPGNIETAVVVMGKLLKSGNELLLVTKPRLACIKRITKEFCRYKTQIRFRFTIGSASDGVLRLWEPGAPSFEERLEALRTTFKEGFSTSISCEPLLDDRFDLLYEKVAPFVTDVIWVGKMNMAEKRVRANTNGSFPEEAVTSLIADQSDERIIALFNKYKEDPKIRWKESIQKVAAAHGLLY